MERSLRILLVGLVTLVFAVTAYAGEYSSDFELYQAEYQQGDMIGAVISMVDRVDLEALKAELDARHADRREWHETVVLALQSKATETQGDILAQLEGLASQGMVEKYQGLWIGNIIIVKATREALDIIVSRDDVETIFPDYPIENIEPVDKGDSPAIAGVESGLRAIRADEVWAMGFTGEGSLVCHLDTGVDGNHPALSSRWRGLDPNYAGHPEWAWFDPVTNTNFPTAFGSHGTHTMGTICGLGGGTGDTIGVAFGAEWMSAGVIDRVSIPQTVADALLSFEWITDPDGDPGTVWDVPDVCSNSWRLTTGHGYPPCDETFWTALDGCEAATIFVVFAAGNEGPGSYTIGNPPARATTDVKSFAIGAVDGNDPNYPIASFSSRGPSNCTPDNSDTFKPEVSAPGVNVRSSLPGSGYGTMSGTSMACPHVAGVVALMRGANPNLTTDQIGEILLQTASDLGDPGEDNTYGTGIVDAYEAVMMSLAYLEGWGTLAGYVTDQASGDPIQGATVSVEGRPWSATTNSLGHYSLFMPADTLWDIRVAHPPTHLPAFDQIMVTENETTYVDYALEGKVTVSLSASFANPADVSYRSFYLKGSWDNDGFYDPTWSGDLVEVTDGDADGVYTGEVMLARDVTNTYSWAIYSENYGGEAARLDDGADFDIPTLVPPTVPTLVVNPSGSDNNWIIAVEGDHGLSLDLAQGVDGNEFKWGAATALVGGTSYTFRFKVMHSEAASYGSGGIGGPDITVDPEVDGSYDFIFNDFNDTYVFQLTGTEGPPTYLSAQSGNDGHIPVSWLAPGTQESQEMSFDDGTLVNAYYYFAYDALMANMFVPADYPVIVDSAIIHVLTEGDPYWPWPDGTHDPVEISIFLDDGTGMPQTDPEWIGEATVEPGDGNWIRADVPDIMVASGNFWVAMNNIAGGGEEGIGLDANTDFPANKWARSGGVWGEQNLYNGDHMIRCKVFGGGRRFWMGYDSEMATALPEDVPVLANPDGTRGTSIAPRLGSAVDSKLVIDRMAYHPNVSRTNPPLISDTEVLAGYNLYRDVATAPFDRDMRINTDLITETSYDDWGADIYGPIANGVLYYYQASAVYDIGGGQFVEVGPSNEATAMAVNHPPQAPQNLVGSSLGNTVYLEWDPVSDYDIAQYRIFRKDYNSNDFNLVGTVDHPQVTFNEDIFVDGIYRYKVASVDAEGMQSDGYSNSVDVPIGAIPPRQLNASTDQEFRIDLDWRHPGMRPLIPNMNVLVVAADNANQFVGELGAFDDVDIADYYDARNGTPTLEELQAYDVAVVWSNYQFNDPVGMGNVLADYVDAGGGVVLQQFSFGTGWNLQGRIMDDYSPLSPGSVQYTTRTLGDYDAGHPIMDGVTTITDLFASFVTIVNNGEWVASWDDGTPFVAYSPDVNVVAVNGYIGDSRQFTGDMIILVHNAMNYALGGAEVIPDNYRVYKSDDISGPFTQIAELPGEQREYSDDPVPNAVDYYYYVTAVYPGPEESDPSNTAMGHGQNYPPQPPENLEAVVDNRDIDLTWTFDDIMGDLDHFNIYKKITPGGTYELAGSTSNLFYTVTIPEGEDGTYALVVTAVDDGSPQLESEPSNQATAPVGNLPPLYLSAISDQDAHVPLNWNEPGLLPTVTLAYDDGALVNGYYYFAYDAIMANQFVADSPVQVETLWVHVLTEGDPFWPWPDGAHDPVGVTLWDDDGTGYPAAESSYYAEVTCNLGEWIMVPIEGGVELTGPNFWVGLNNLAGGGEDGMGLDANTDFPEYKWARTSGVWAQQNTYNGDHMIRATIVDTGGRRLRLDEKNPTEEMALANLNSKSDDIPEPLDTEIILGYNVYRSTSPGVPVDPAYKINTDYVVPTEYDDTDVINETTYYYVVTAVYDNDGSIEESPASNEVEATPRTPAMLELDPMSMSAMADPGQVVSDLLNIANPGGLELQFTIDTQTDRRRPMPEGDSPDWSFQAKFTSYEEQYNKGNEPVEPTEPPMTLGRGGPDEWGYSWIDSDEPGGPAPDWVDITGIGVQLFMSDDNNQGPFDMGFTFPFYGNNFTSLRVVSNGWASFTSTLSYYYNQPIPDPSQPLNLLAPFWDDLNPSLGGEIWYYSDENYAAVSWIDVPHYGSGGPYTFQIVLYPNGQIRYNYLTINYPDDSATIGIQNGDGTIGLQVAFNQVYLHSDMSILFTQGWLSAEPTAGSVAPGDNTDATITFDATLLEEGTYTGSLIVTGYDINHMVDQITVPVTFYVGTGPLCDYVLGDYNGSGAFNVADVVAAFSKLKLGFPDAGLYCECPAGSGHEWAVAMDVNNSCAFNVADVVIAYSKLKTGAPELEACEDCPPPPRRGNGNGDDRPLVVPTLKSKAVKTNSNW